MEKPKETYDVHKVVIAIVMVFILFVMTVWLIIIAVNQASKDYGMKQQLNKHEIQIDKHEIQIKNIEKKLKNVE